jgi:hypothetical protein
MPAFLSRKALLEVIESASPAMRLSVRFTVAAVVVS